MSDEGSCMGFLLMSEGRRFPGNAALIYETGFGRGLREMVVYLTQLDSTGTLRIPDPDWAAMRLLGLVMPPVPMMCAGFSPPAIPSLDDVRKCIRLFLKGMDASG